MRTEKRVAGIVEGDFEISGATVQGNCPAVYAGLHDFDSGSSARRQKVEHALPVIGRTEVQAEEILVSWLGAGLPRQTTDLRGRSMVDLADAGVEATDAAESGGEGDLGHGQSGLIDELLGEVKAASLRDGNRSGAEMTQEEAAQVTRANSQALGQDFDATIFKAAFADQTQGSRDRIRSTQPRGRSRRTLRATT